MASCVSFASYTNLQSVVSFCDTRLIPAKVQVIINEGKAVGLSNGEALNEQLKNSDYIPVLKAIWSERDRSRRLEWLRSHAPEMHAPLMYEQALAEFVASQTVETVTKISLPLIQAATFRVYQDSQCSSDASVYKGDAPVRMKLTYLKSLDTLTKKFLKTPLSEIKAENNYMAAKVVEVAQASMSQELPSPNWIGHHGMSVFIDGKIAMHPEENHKEIRKKAAEEIIEKLNQTPNP